MVSKLPIEMRVQPCKGSPRTPFSTLFATRACSAGYTQASREKPENEAFMTLRDISIIEEAKNAPAVLAVSNFGGYRLSVKY